MSPILLRPIREQLEHDRVIRQLQTRWLRRCEVGINVGNEETVSVRSRDRTCFPDLVLTRTAGGRRLHGVIEVETSESVNHLEAMSEWSHFAKVRGSFYLYVPAGFTEIALRLCQATKINVTEIWAYYAIDSQAKFSMSYRSPRARQQAKAVSVMVEKKPASARKATPTKKSKVAEASSKATQARPTAKKSTKKRKPAATKKPAKAKARKANKTTRRASIKRTVPKTTKKTKKTVPKKTVPKKTKKKTKTKLASTVQGRRTGKTSAAHATKRSSKRFATAKRRT